MAKKPKASTTAVPLKLQGKSVFLGGNFYHRDEPLRTLIKLEGGKIVAELTDKTDLLVLGYSGAANPQKKAVKLNAQGAAIQVVAMIPFEQQIKPTPDEAAQLLLSGRDGIERWNCHLEMTPPHQAGFAFGPQRSGVPPYIRGADFSSADLSSAQLGELADHCDFTGANLKGCSLVLSNCQLEGANLDDVLVLKLIDCSAQKVDFSKVAAEHAYFDGSNFSGARFGGKRRRYYYFVKCQLDDADLSGLEAPTSGFKFCSLRNARLVGAKLDQVDFSQSDLSGADFSKADLKLAKLTGAKVDGADFSGAIMVGADVASVDFSKAKNFDPAQVQTKGGPGAAVKEFLQAAVQANHVATSLTVTQGMQEIVLTLDVHPHWTCGRDSVPNYYHAGNKSTPAASASMWASMATKWYGAVPNLASLKVRATKAKTPGKELKQLALKGWCELFGIETPSDEDLKKAAVSSKAQKKEKAEEWIAILRSGKKGVQKWNASAEDLSKMLDKASGIDLANAKLSRLTLLNLEWKGANLSGADLSKGEFLRCRFPEGNFAGANLKGATLRSCTFHDANLESTDATSADLWGTSFKRANCKTATFAKAELRASDLCGADFTGADLSGAELTQASYDEHTKWPKGFTPTLEMVWKGPGTSPAAHKLVQSTKPKGKLDTEQFMTRLEELTDIAKLGKALSMLKADRFRLYAQVNNDHFVGVVKSQSDPDLVYSCRLNADGTYACCTQNLNICGGLRGSLCKHLLVLIVGLTKNNELDPNVIDTWIRLSKTNKPALDKDAMSETFLRYKGAEAGEVDWRPTETIPEDYYAM